MFWKQKKQNTLESLKDVTQSATSDCISDAPCKCKDEILKN